MAGFEVSTEVPHNLNSNPRESAITRPVKSELESAPSASVDPNPEVRVNQRSAASRGKDLEESILVRKESGTACSGGLGDGRARTG